MSMTRNGDFVLIRKPLAGVKHMKPGVTVGLSTDADADSKRNHHRISIRVSSEVMDELAWLVGEYVLLHEGTGPSTGKLLLVNGADDPRVGYKISAAAARQEKGARKKDDPTKRADGSTMPGFIGVGCVALQYHTHPNHSVGSTPVKYRVFNGELLIDMPQWFKGIVRQAIAQEQGNRPVPSEDHVELYPKDLPRKRPYARGVKQRQDKKRGKPA